MSTQHTHVAKKTSTKSKSRSKENIGATSRHEATPATALDHNLLSPDDVLQLQRIHGNHYTTKVVQQARNNILNATPPTTDTDNATDTDTDSKIQRLPTKTQVESKVGKAGFYVFNKTSWANFLKALDEFNKAEKKKDKTKQLEEVIKLQTYTNEWLASESRKTTDKKKKAKDDVKREFLNQLRPDLKILYYELKTKSKTVDIAEVNADKYADDNIQVIKQKLLKEGIDDSKKTIKAMLQVLKDADLTYNFNANVLNFLIDSPDMKTIWQIAYKDKSPGGTIPSNYDKMTGSEKREAAERWLGYDPFSDDQRDNRPAYVGVNVLSNPKGAAPSYGRFFFELKDSVKNRTTYTPYDTFEMISNTSLKDIPEKTTGTTDNMEAILAHNDGVLKVLGNLVNDIKMTEKEVALAMGKYMEGQVHGGMTIQDVETLVVDYPKNKKDRASHEQADADIAENFLKKYPNIKLRHR